MSCSTTLGIDSKILIGNSYRVSKKIGSGSFGEIFNGINANTGEEVAVKFESLNLRYPLLDQEKKMYDIVKNGCGIPRIHWYGQEGNCNILVMELLRDSLNDLFKQCGRQFTIKTVLMIADQMITRIEYVHSKGVIHRDIKPHNFLMGRGMNSNLVYLIDFGLAKRYIDEQTGSHINEENKEGFAGTLQFASVNVQCKNDASRRDDLESLGYCFIYFLRGNLPWNNLRCANKKQKYEKITEIKMNTSAELLCQDLPSEFILYFNYCRGLSFDETPNYEYLRKLFQILFFQTLKFRCDENFDWNAIENQKTAVEGTSTSN